VGKTLQEDLGVFNDLPRHRIYDMYARDLQALVRDGDQLSVLYTGRSMTTAAFILPVTDQFTAALGNAQANARLVAISSLKERDIIELLREQDRDEVRPTLTVTLSGVPVVYIVPFNDHWRTVVAGVMGLSQ
jgi:hypothetical protein